jgi:hypothetical protein
MNVRRFGDSDLYITPVGFGAWAIKALSAQAVG